MDTEAVAFVGNLITGPFGDDDWFEVTDYASFLTDAMATRARLMVNHPKETLSGLDIVLVGYQKQFMPAYVSVLKAASAIVQIVDDSDSALFNDERSFMAGNSAALTLALYFFSLDKTFQRAQQWQDKTADTEIMLSAYQTPVNVLLDVEEWWLHRF
ncbi:hypothetical protein [Weissella cibaria]|uniref:hypothetical protein n=1 Tax=Weissella cibaria TaxID=137591 RepID=UPI00106E0D60|nr:hypothetical protein [Weissella cibaria]